MIKFKPLVGRQRDKMIKSAMKYSKKDLAIMYVDLKWCFDTISRKPKEKNQ